jgi:hypothetical protein
MFPVSGSTDVGSDENDFGLEKKTQAKMRRILNIDEPHITSEPFVQPKNNIISKRQINILWRGSACLNHPFPKGTIEIKILMT